MKVLKSRQHEHCDDCTVHGLREDGARGRSKGSGEISRNQGTDCPRRLAKFTASRQNSGLTVGFDWMLFTRRGGSPLMLLDSRLGQDAYRSSERSNRREIGVGISDLFAGSAPATPGPGALATTSLGSYREAGIRAAATANQSARASPRPRQE